MPDLSANRISLHYELAGDGPPLVLIAGLASDGASWAPVTPFLAPHARLILPDNRGCGQTQVKDGAVTIEAMADDIIALLDHLEIEQTDMLGHSMGGVIAMSIAAQRPERLRRLILSATTPAVPPRARSIIETLVSLREAGAPEEDWYRAFFHWLFHPPFFESEAAVAAAISMARAYPHAQSPADMRRQVDALRAYDASALPAQMETETLILAGEGDLLFPPHLIAENFRSLKNCRVEILPDAAHSLQWDQPEGFAGAVVRFLR
jgi:pimeloyl-ACP methyl ester carboxylesterase